MKLLKIHEVEVMQDNRGWSLEPVNSSLLEGGGVKNIHIVSIEPGGIRGNHVHSEQTEWVLVFGGRCLVAAQDKSGLREEMIIETDRRVVLEIPPGVAHAFKNIGERTSYLLALCSLAYSHKNPDWQASALLE